MVAKKRIGSHRVGASPIIFKFCKLSNYVKLPQRYFLQASALRRSALVRPSVRPSRCRPSLVLMLLLLPTLFILSASASAYLQQQQEAQQQQQDTLLYKRSERQCSAGNLCKEEDFFHYYGCNFGICDFHLQPWLYVLIAFIVLCFLLSVLISLINCVCCRN